MIDVAVRETDVANRGRLDIELFELLREPLGDDPVRPAHRSSEHHLASAKICLKCPYPKEGNLEDGGSGNNCQTARTVYRRCTLAKKRPLVRRGTLGRSRVYTGGPLPNLPVLRMQAKPWIETRTRTPSRSRFITYLSQLRKFEDRNHHPAVWQEACPGRTRWARRSAAASPQLADIAAERRDGRVGPRHKVARA